MMKKILIQWSVVLTLILGTLSAVGYYLGSSIQLKLSLTDLLPQNHPAVVKFEKLTEVVGGVGYFAMVLHSEDEKSHLEVAPKIVEAFKKSDLVRSVFYNREQHFFIDRLLYYVDLPKLKDLEKNISKEITRLKRTTFDLGLWEEEETEKPESQVEEKSIFDNDLKKLAKKSAGVSPYLISKDKKDLLVMVKPSFDSMDMEKTNQLVAFSEGALKQLLPAGVSYEFGERYYTKVVESKMIQSDIFILGSLAILVIAGIIYLYLRSFRALLIIFLPVMMGMGITVGVTRLVIGHINIITGFLMGIVSGLGVDYGIHLLLRLRLEKTEPSSGDPDPVWRVLASSGHSVFVGAVAASVSFFLLCFSSFRAFSEFGFICGVGITAVLICLLSSFSAYSKLFKLDVAPHRKSLIPWTPKLPVLSIPKGFLVGTAITILLLGLSLKVRFEYDFDKMLQHSKKMEALSDLIDAIYDRSSTPSAVSVPSKEEALEIEKVIKDKYMPGLVSEMISAASIIPENQQEKYLVLQRIDEKIKPFKDKWIEQALDVPASVVRDWVQAKPFTFDDLPLYIQDPLRGTQQGGFLIYLYPAISLSELVGVKKYAAMIRDIEVSFPNALTGSDAVIFSDILDLIGKDGAIILAIIFVSVGLFIWINVRKPKDTLLSYLPLLLALPVGMGLMTLFGVKFNIFNICIIPTFVAMGIDVPIHIVHRARECGSGFKAARDLATSINLALMTAAVGFGVLIFARAGVLKSLGWIALLGTAAIWWIGLFMLPAFLEKYSPGKGESHGSETHSVEAEEF
jgi:predicted RND superfamily exporter protein